MTRTIFALIIVAILGTTWAWFERPDLVLAASQHLPAPVASKVQASLAPAGLKSGAQPQGQQASDPAQQGGQAAAKRNAVAVAVARAESGDFPIRRRSIGTIEPVATVTVRSRIDSQLNEQLVNDGQMVRKGDLLFKLDDRELRATLQRDQATLARDEALLDRAQADLKRKRDLLSSSAGSQQQVDQAVSDAKSAEAAVAGDRAAIDLDQVKLSYTEIKAPMDGRVGTVQVSPGNLVRSGDTGPGLVTITQVKPVRVTFTLPERELGALRKALGDGSPPMVRVRPNGQDKAVASGPVSFVDSAVDTASGTITVKAEFPNEDLSLWPGQYVDVEVDLDTRKDTVTVPTVAVQTGQNSPYVFVVKDDNTAELRNVQVLAEDGGRTALSEGLKAGETVVVDGQMRLNNGMPVRTGKDAPKPVAQNTESRS